ncbi:MAG: hypothetical protein ABR578_06120 [Chromatocurvus sp.]
MHVGLELQAPEHRGAGSPDRRIAATSPAYLNQPGLQLEDDHHYDRYSRHHELT